MKKSKVYSLRSKVFPGRRGAASGFTLIELMMVVLVILLLSGLLFKLGAIMRDRGQRSRALADIQNISNAIEAYFAAYGQYPPTDGMVYEGPATNGWSYPMVVDQSLFYTNAVFTNDFKYGLVAYLYERGGDNPDQSLPDFDPLYDAERNAVAQQWQHLLADVDLTDKDKEHEKDFPGIGPQSYSNKVQTIKDPWNDAYNYESRPPYLSYRLWSNNLD